MSQSNFFEGFMDDTLEQVMSSYAEELHGKAASVVDPETGKQCRFSSVGSGRKDGLSTPVARLLSPAHSNNDWVSTRKKFTA